MRTVPSLDTYDVAIIGYGPVGAIAANLLGQYGIRTVVIEREETIYELPRAIVVDDEILRIFQYIGLVDEILPLTHIIEGEQFLNSKREVLFTVRLASLHNGYPPSNAFYQPRLEAVLRRGVERFPCVHVYCGHEVNTLMQDETGVTVIMQSRSALEGERQLRVQYVLGCDGAKSITRTTAGIRLRNLKSHQAWLVVDALLKDGQEGPQTQFVQQYCNPIRPETFVPSAQNHLRWEFMLVAGEEKEDITHLEKVRNLLSSWIDPDKLEIMRSAVYTFHALLAQQWRSGRLFLLGDAAHQMPPFLGQGMCTGIRDAYNLCWKLALVLRGQAHSALLESYQQEREPHARTTITLTVNFGKIIQARQPLAMLRDSILPLLAHIPGAFSMHAPPLTAGLLMHTPTDKQKLRTKVYALFASMTRKRTSAQGTLLPQPTVRTAAGAHVLLDEVLGSSFAIIGINVNPRSCLDSTALIFWDSLPTRFVQVTAFDKDDESVAHIEDSEKQLADWFARQQGTIAVVRPDRYIFGIFTPHSLYAATQRLQMLLQES